MAKVFLLESSFNGRLDWRVHGAFSTRKNALQRKREYLTESYCKGDVWRIRELAVDPYVAWGAGLKPDE